MAFVGRTRALSGLLATVEDASRGRAHLVLVRGEAGIGKTMLLGEVAARSRLAVGWGTCVDADRAPAFWPWTTALRSLLSALAPAVAEAVTEADTAELARLLPELAPADLASPQAVPTDGDAARLRLFDAVARLLERLARCAPSLVVLDDLQWADESSMALLRFVAATFRPVPLVILGAYRHDELDAATAQALAGLARISEPVPLHGLSTPELSELLADVAGRSDAERWAAEIHRRTDGHPFFARQLIDVLTGPGGSPGVVPAGARELVARRMNRLTATCRTFLEAAAVAGNDLQPDVLGDVCGADPAAVASFIDQGVSEGVLVRDGDRPGLGARMAHDLFRETIAAGLGVERRLGLHQRIADALEHRRARGAAVAPMDLARHCAAAVPLEGGGRAVRWARAAAAAERGRLAFGEAAAHLARARVALEDAGHDADGSVLVDLLIEEADARARTGDPGRARALLGDAKDRALAMDDAERLGEVALGTQRLGARFAMPRDDIVDLLEAARAALHDTGTALEAQLTANLARELHHSVPAERARARPLSEQATMLARRLDDPATLVACLLARHDVLWTPGRAAERIAVAREITELAARSGDAERHAEGLLLTANALLEAGAADFRGPLVEYLLAEDRFGQPRHAYMAMTRRGALALIDGNLDEAERLIADAATFGTQIGEPDTGNVRMSQMLGLVRARGEPARLRATAAEAIRWWVGVPSHAHAVAAGFLVLAGAPEDLVAARRALDTVVAIGTWRDDRSYLWPVFVGAMATAAAGLGDRRLCGELLAELEPVVDTCGVNGALVCFMGSNAHWAGVLAGALGRLDQARLWLDQAMGVHHRLGATAWEAETCRELARLTPTGGRTVLFGAGDGAPLAEASVDAELRQTGGTWTIGHNGTTFHMPALKGFADLAELLAHPGVDVHVLRLAGAGHADRATGTLLDPTARAAYRSRLAEIDDDLSAAQTNQDIGRVQFLEAQRSALLIELRRSAGISGRSRPLGSSTTERARKAVTARLRDAIHRVGVVLPELGAHLDRSIRTGTTCSYEPAEPVCWRL